jgi:putative endopeptidase
MRQGAANVFALLLVACASTSHPTSPRPIVATPAVDVAVHETTNAGLWRGIDVHGMDRRVDPLADFDAYASGNWYRENPIPPDQGSWSTGQLIKQNNQEILRKILERAALETHASPNSPAGRLGAFYRSAMNETAIDAAGLRPIEPLLARIDALESPEQLWKALPGLYMESSVFAPIPFHTDTDPRNNTRLVLVVDAGGLGLPHQDDYVREDEKAQRIRVSYAAHLQRMFVLLGDAPDTAAMESAVVFAFERRLARAMRAGADREPGTLLQPMTMAEVDAITPGLSWTSLSSAMGIAGSTAVVVTNPGFLREIQIMLREERISTWRSYLRWQLVRALAPALSKAMSQESFAFDEQVLGGRLQELPRWKRAVMWADELIGEDLGQLYVAQQFTSETKERAHVMIATIVSTLQERIGTLDWLSTSAKQDAVAKLGKITFKIGYPAKWRDYSGLIVDDGPFAINYLRARRFGNQWMLSRLGKPRDVNEWENTPPTINAYCDPLTLEVVFSAGILQPPFFDPTADDEINYAEIGSVIGHELTHLFWWTGDDAATFTRRAHAIEQQYSSYALPDGLHVNGKLTLSENIADIGGLKVAYLAWKRSLRGRALPPVRNGLTAEQRFFVAYAQSWRMQSRPETARLRIASDPHAPGHFRIVGPLSNMPEFYEAFDQLSTPPRALLEGIW